MTSVDIASATSPTASFISDVAGEYVIALEVYDGELVGEAFHTVTAATIANVPPVADAGADQSVLTGSFVALDGSASNDPDAQPVALTYNWIFDSIPAASALTNDQIADATMPTAGFVPDVDGTYVLMLEVFDGEDSATATVTIIASAANIPPVADAGIDQEVTLGNTVFLDGSGSNDPDLGPNALSYSWSFASLPAGSAISDTDITNATTATPEFIPDTAGEYLLRLDVTDGVESDFDQVLVIVGEPPAIPQNVIGRARLYHVNLVWDASIGAASYNIYRKLDTEADFTFMDTVTDVTVFVDDMPDGTVYADYYVEALNDFGVSDPSDVVQVLPAFRTR